MSAVSKPQSILFRITFKDGRILDVWANDAVMWRDEALKINRANLWEMDELGNRTRLIRTVANIRSVEKL